MLGIARLVCLSALLTCWRAVLANATRPLARPITENEEPSSQPWNSPATNGTEASSSRTPIAQNGTRM